MVQEYSTAEENELNYSELAEKQLKNAVETGMIVVTEAEGVRVIKLRASEILGVAKYIVKEGLFKGDAEAEKASMPSEMFVDTNTFQGLYNGEVGKFERFSRYEPENEADDDLSL